MMGIKSLINKLQATMKEIRMCQNSSSSSSSSSEMGIYQIE
jgi:hypothetical protein